MVVGGGQLSGSGVISVHSSLAALLSNNVQYSVEVLLQVEWVLILGSASGCCHPVVSIRT